MRFRRLARRRIQSTGERWPAHPTHDETSSTPQPETQACASDLS
jgi:hypothetical protein